ncbi:hypothetical protein [Photobacterium sanguinicancri]|uniref:hypothetical protein n=1 Tax=Photobacterium sanguinicancri TaxID=875932 RepID=UPI000ADE7549|nr:hypothetical protein [Photobacterium sanguinicancri]
MSVQEVLNHPSLKEFIVIIASIVTAITTLLAVIITNNHNKKIVLINTEAQLSKEYKDRKLQKIEELYLILAKWKKDALKTTLIYSAYHNGKLQRNDIAELLPTAKGGLGYDPLKISILVDIFLPELKETSEILARCHEKLFISHEATKENDKTFIPKILVNQEKFDKQCKKLLEEIVVAAKNL